MSARTSYRQSINYVWQNRTVSTSGSGFQQLFKLFTVHLPETHTLPQSIVFHVAAVSSTVYAFAETITCTVLRFCHGIVDDIPSSGWPGDITSKRCGRESSRYF